MVRRICPSCNGTGYVARTSSGVVWAVNTSKKIENFKWDEHLQDWIKRWQDG